MGIVIKQSIKGTIWSYLGVIIGFITTAYLFPNYLTTEIVGLLGIIVSYSQIFGRISLLGLQGTTSRLFPFFRNPANKHNGFLFVALLYHILGFCIFILAYFLLKPYLIKTNIDNSPLFVQYIYLIIPTTVATMIFTFLDTYNKMLYNAVFGIFLKDFVQRILLLTTTLAYVFRIINLKTFIIIYIIAICIKVIIIIIHLLLKKEINLTPKRNFITPSLRKEMVSVSLFNIIGNAGAIIVFNLDKIIINQYLDLSYTGIYTITFYFGSLVAIPSRPLIKISEPLIAEAWKTDDRETINKIYYKSCLNQLIIGGFLLLGLWVNIDNILEILGSKYYPGKWVILIIGLGYLIDMTTGTNGSIIGLSKYFRLNLLFMSILVIFMLLFMNLLVPKWGITGGATAIALALFLNNLMRFIFLKIKYEMQPFNGKFLIVIAFYLALYFIIKLIPQQFYIIDVLIRGGIIAFSSLLFYSLTPISEDIRNTIIKIFKLIKEKLIK